MAAMTVQQLRDYARLFLDTDSVDLPDALCDVFIAEAVDNIARASMRWRFYEATFPFNSAPGIAEYPLVTIAPTASDVTALQGPNFALRQIGQAAALKEFTFNSVAGANPRKWVRWGDSIFLYPTPSVAQAFTLVGYRNPVQPTSGSTFPDLPDEFHPIVAKWTLALAYQQQDDTYSSQLLLSEASQSVQALRKRYESVQAGGPSVMGGNPPKELGRLLYDFEV